jgi:hypothetical protein
MNKIFVNVSADKEEKFIADVKANKEKYEADPKIYLVQGASENYMVVKGVKYLGTTSL